MTAVGLAPTGAPARGPALAALADLRAATAAEHARLERRLDVPARCRSAGEYRRLLEGFWVFHAAVEPRLAAAARRHGVLPGWSRRDVLPRLAADLDDLGCGPDRRAGLPAARVPPLVGPDDVWGCLYVVEGAALGGGVVTDLVARSVPVGAPGLPTRFFAGAGDARGRRWHDVRTSLGAWLTGPGRPGAVQAAARATFHVVERCCAGPSPGPAGAGAGAGGRGTAP